MVKFKIIDLHAPLLMKTYSSPGHGLSEQAFANPDRKLKLYGGLKMTKRLTFILVVINLGLNSFTSSHD